MSIETSTASHYLRFLRGALGAGVGACLAFDYGRDDGRYGRDDGRLIIRMCAGCARPGPHITLQQADPRVMVSAEMLQALSFDGGIPGITTDMTFGQLPIRGCTIRIEGCNRTAVYRVGAGDILTDCFACEWPD